jgi:hypothetical protein
MLKQEDDGDDPSAVNEAFEAAKDGFFELADMLLDASAMAPFVGPVMKLAQTVLTNARTVQVRARRPHDGGTMHASLHS